MPTFGGADEMHFATNHLGHLDLALGLQKALAAAGQARIVVVSSGEHMLSPRHGDACRSTL
jgi:NAD(P)-dependent dehydrogenase (short-subunit alcohol dehydrogenase family)